MSKIKTGSNRSFGITFFILFFFIGLWPLLNNDTIRIWSILISLIFLILGLVNSKYLEPINILWFKFGILLRTLFSPIIMGLVFFLVLTPTALFIRVLGKDLLKRKLKKNKITYWIYRDKSKSSFKNQF